MKEVVGNIWDFHTRGEWIVVTTNGMTNSRGEAIMGRGIALQAKSYFPALPKELGILLRRNGNKCYTFPAFRIITFPTKNDWRQNSSLPLIRQSAIQLREDWEDITRPLYLPRPGCGNGGLLWSKVKSVIEDILDDERFVVVHHE